MASIAFASRVEHSGLSMSRIVSIAQRLPNRLRSWNFERRTRASLGRLSDRQLDDIGLSRGDVDYLTFGDAGKR